MISELTADDLSRLPAETQVMIDLMLEQGATLKEDIRVEPFYYYSGSIGEEIAIRMNHHTKKHQKWEDFSKCYCSGCVDRGEYVNL